MASSGAVLHHSCHIPQCTNELTTCPPLSFSWGSGWDQVSFVNIGSLAKPHSSNLKLPQFCMEPCVQPPLTYLSHDYLILVSVVYSDLVSMVSLGTRLCSGKLSLLYGFARGLDCSCCRCALPEWMVRNGLQVFVY